MVNAPAIRLETRPALLRRALEELTPIRRAALVVALASFLVYQLTLMPGVTFGDWGEFQTGPYLTAVLHPTGYPLYTIVAKLFALLPLGSIAHRTNVMSAVSASGALAVVTLTMGRLGAGPVVSAFMALALGAVSTVWLDATYAEAQTLHLLFLALIVHRLLLWYVERAPRHLYLGALLLGLSFGNHMLTATLAPIVVIGALVLGRDVIRSQPRAIAITAGAFGAGLLPYLYIPLATLSRPGAALFNDPWSEACWPISCATADGFRNLVLGQQFSGQMRFLSPEGLPRFFDALPKTVGHVAWEATPLFVVLAAIGAISLGRSQRAFVVTTGAIALVNVYVYANYFSFPDYLLATWMVLALWAAVGARAVLDTTSRPLLRFALAALPAVLLVSNWSAVDQSANRDGDRFVDEVFGHLPQNAVILSTWDSVNPMWYAHYVEGRRPDLMIVNQADISDDLVGARPLYALHMFDDWLDPLRKRYRLTEVAKIPLAYGSINMQHPRPLYRAEPLAAGAP